MASGLISRASRNTGLYVDRIVFAVDTCRFNDGRTWVLPPPQR
ncbi:hypothetical protein ACYTFC_00110 [Streptomyces globosus]|nr:hypothetical protein [Streptomyces sp. WAC05292]